MQRHQHGDAGVFRMNIFGRCLRLAGGAKVFPGLVLVALLSACGGGGGNAGNPVFPGDGSGDGGTAVKYTIAVEVQRSGAAVSQIASAETAQAVATVRNSSGGAVPGVLVKFTETDSTLLAFQPQAATALTDSAGKATLDVGAKGLTSTGATTVTAAATVAGIAVTAARSISITGSAVTTPVPAAINFVSSSAQGQAIVVKGAGGSGRAESAILSFTVVDAAGAPINGAAVDFQLNSSNGGATTSPIRALSDSSGKVTTTVLSGTQPASIVVTATAQGANGSQVSTQSDTLLVSNSVPVKGGFEIVAEKYNLDGQRTGDSTKISAFVRDQFGNLVPDGLAVSFVTDLGAVGSSQQGGCTTVNGTCSVDFRVQEPRGGGLATVIASVRVGQSEVLADGLNINMAASGAYVAWKEDGTAPLTVLSLNSCKQLVIARLQDAVGRSVAAGTTIAADLSTSNTVVAIRSGTPVGDQLSNFAPTTFGFEIDLTNKDLVPACKPGGTPTPLGGFLQLRFSKPGGAMNTQRIDFTYPQ